MLKGIACWLCNSVSKNGLMLLDNASRTKAWGVLARITDAFESTASAFACNRPVQKAVLVANAKTRQNIAAIAKAWIALIVISPLSPSMEGKLVMNVGCNCENISFRLSC